MTNTFLMCGVHPEHAGAYTEQLAAPANEVDMRCVPYDPTRHVADYAAASMPYWVTAASSDFVRWQGQPLYITPAMAGVALAGEWCRGLYIHELVAYFASRNGWRWHDAARAFDTRLIATLMEAVRVNGKRLIWSEPSGGWEALRAVQPGLLAQAGATLVPMFGTNFAGTRALAVWAANEVAKAGELALGDSVQSWAMLDEGKAITQANVDALFKLGTARHATVFQIEGQWADLLPTSPYMAYCAVAARRIGS